MFAWDLSFSKAIMAARQAGRAQGAAQRVYRLPADRPLARQAAGRER
jgi:hypothetical protein